MEPNIAILLLNGFDEFFVFEALRMAKNKDLNSVLVSLRRKAVPSYLDVDVVPSETLEMFVRRQNACSFLVPPCGSANSVLLTDPRLHKVFHQVIENGGKLLMAAQPAGVLARVGFFDREIKGDLKVVQSVSEVAQHI